MIYMSKKAERTLKALKVLYFSANFTMGIVLALFCGYVTQYMWNNLVVAIFNVQILTYWQAVAIDLFISYIVPNKIVKDDGYTGYEKMAYVFFSTVICWGAAAILTMFI